MKKISLYIDSEVDRALERRAAAEGVTKAELVCRVLAEAVSGRPRPLARGVFEGPPDLASGVDHYLLKPSSPSGYC